MPLQQMMQRRHYVFVWSVPRLLFCSVSSLFLSLRKNSERIQTKFAGDMTNRCHQQIKGLHFGQHWNMEMEVFESTSIGVPRCQTDA